MFLTYSSTLLLILKKKSQTLHFEASIATLQSLSHGLKTFHVICALMQDVRWTLQKGWWVEKTNEGLLVIKDKEEAALEIVTQSTGKLYFFKFY